MDNRNVVQPAGDNDVKGKIQGDSVRYKQMLISSLNINQGRCLYIQEYFYLCTLVKKTFFKKTPERLEDGG